MRLIGPTAAEVIVPSAGLQEIVEIETKNQPRKRKVDASLGLRADLFPVTVFRIYVRTRFFAGRAFGPESCGGKQTTRFGVDLLR